MPRRKVAATTVDAARDRPPGLRPKILYLVSEDWYFRSHRLPVARAARDAGWEVVVLTRLNRDADAIAAEGFRALPLRLKRGSRSLVAGLATALHIARAYRRERPDLVHHVNLKMCLLGCLAVRIAQVPSLPSVGSLPSPAPRVVNGLTGMGSLFVGAGLQKRALRWAVLTGLRVLSPRGSRLIVQNRDDHDLMLRHRVARPSDLALIRGSGVDVRRLVPRREPSGVATVTYVGRMLAVKGVRELVAAGRLLKARGVTVRIALVGPTDRENPDCLDEATLRRWTDEGIVHWCGFEDDIVAVWARSTVAVLPTYREGMPKSLLEAAACGVPMIATDVPGCRDLVRDGDNGLLVPPRDPAALADAIARLLASPELRRKLGRGARRTAETEFAEEVVAARTLTLYRSVAPPPPGAVG